MKKSPDKSEAAKPPTSSPSTFSSAKILIAALILIGSAVFLFARLGHYALWDDEAGTALNAVAIWRTGDTSAVIDHNIVAYQNGKDLRNLKERFMPPLPAYLTAPFVGLLGQQAWVARLPFALCGLLCVALMVHWLRKINPETPMWIAATIAILCNVSLFLFFRNCRYYGLAILTTTLLAYLYWNWDGRRRTIIGFTLISICLFASNYLNYVALYCCLAVDFFLWSRKRIKLSLVDWIILLLPQLVVCALIFWIWNPLAKPPAVIPPDERISRAMLFWWYWRDSVLEFSNPILLVLAPIVCFFRAGLWLPRLLLALLLYIVVITVAAPHPPPGNDHIEVRYLAPCLPLFIAVGLMTLGVLARRLPQLLIPLAVLAFAIGWHPNAYGPARMHAAVVDYTRELIKPPDDPYTLAAHWINEHLEEKQSIWVWPGYMTYPLLFHAPKALYAWQLTGNNTDEQFQKLDRIHFQHRSSPDYILVFGPDVEMLYEQIFSRPKPGFAYKPAGVIDFYWNPVHRPEFLRRSFTPITNYDNATEAIYIMQRTDELPGRTMEPRAPGGFDPWKAR